MRAGPHNALTDVPGLRVGHAALGRGQTGTTVVLAPPDGAVGGVDVRGAAPGTRETDLLDPQNYAQRVHAVVFSGGSAYGLAAADGVMARLEAVGIGVPVPGGVVPIVPAAVVFDLGRGGDFTARPHAGTGAAAFDAAAAGPIEEGVVGAGRGAQAGGLKGGIGTASVVLESGATVAALAVVNAAGSAVDLTTGALLGARLGLPGEFPPVDVTPAALAQLRELAGRKPPRLGTATTLALVATDITLDKAGASRLATMGHDGLARALAPVHTIFDGDAVFALSTADRPAPDPLELMLLQAAAADVVARAIARGMLAATTVATPAGTWRSYRDVLAGH
ncbi:P1 family peptidase [Pseudonocardia sp. GCM10023141]|uniref:P1 family peptidase n=1 Tax=Pseudonocardia sp. GCM10023141 TaxID=3252653 RepID=UPI00361A8D7F